jgi:POT family proton-dependent oligopeptide transporter
MAKYRSAPVPSTKMPKGIPYIISNEMAERFSFSGMRGILVVFMTTYLMGSNGELATMSAEDAKTNYHLFMSALYFFPLVGAFFADVLFGKYYTIIAFSLIYCLGHGALALDDTQLGLFAGLMLIAIGSGGIKPCVSANLGDQFGASNQHLLSKVFGWFYFSINVGQLLAALMIPILLNKERFYEIFAGPFESIFGGDLHDVSWISPGPSLAFGVPGVFMLLATVCFWSGRNKFVHIRPSRMNFIKEAISPEGLRAIGKLSIAFSFLIVFWSLIDQTGSSWVLQAKQMDLNFMGFEWLPSQVQAANNVFLMVFIVLFNYVVYPAVEKVIRVTALRKISVGLFLAAAGFSIPIWIESQIQAGNTPNIGWQVFAYAVLMSAEVLVSITFLEFSYTQAPKKMKSVVSAMCYLTVSVGNLLTAAVNYNIQNEDGTSKLEGASYYVFFTGMMLASAIVFVFVAYFYKEKRYIQDEETVDA